MFWEAQHPVSEQATRRAGDHSRGEVNLNVRETEGETEGEKNLQYLNVSSGVHSRALHSLSCFC